MIPFVPVVLAALSVPLAALLGFSERSFFGTALEDQFYGFFLRGYPLFLFAVAYGAARIVTAAVAEPGPRRPLRAFTAPVALALFLAASVYPSFGGVILRPGFFTGGVGFLQGLNAHAAAVLGAAAAAFTFGLVLGACTILATLRVRRSWATLGEAVLSFLALWVGAVILLGPQRLGIDLVGAFPQRPLTLGQAGLVAALVALAVLPHALVKARRSRETQAARA